MLLSIKTLKCNLPAYFNLIISNLESDSRYERLCGLVFFEFLKRNASHEHPLNRKWFFIYSCGNALLHFNDLKTLSFAYICECFKNITGRKGKRYVEFEVGEVRFHRDGSNFALLFVLLFSLLVFISQIMP